MPLCCCRRRRTNRVEEADTKTRNQETLHYTHRDGVVTVTREYSHPSWGNAQTIEDVFNPRIVDDGVCSVTAFTHKHHGVLEPYYFWLARFGGNANGHVIRGDAGPSEEYLPGERCTTPPSQGLPLTYSREMVVVRSLLGGPWVAVAQNVDDDLTWTCPTNPAPEGFMERFREVAERG